MANEYQELRNEAKTLGINTFQMSKSALREAITAATIDIVEQGLPAAAPAPKKAGASWRWRNRFEVEGKDPNFRYRFVDTDESNLRDKVEDGWRFVHPSTGVPGEHIDPKQVADGDPLSGAQTYRGMALMALPEDRAKARDQAVRAATEGQTVNLKGRLAQELSRTDEGGKASIPADVHGKITIIE